MLTRSSFKFCDHSLGIHPVALNMLLLLQKPAGASDNDLTRRLSYWYIIAHFPHQINVYTWLDLDHCLILLLLYLANILFFPTLSSKTPTINLPCPFLILCIVFKHCVNIRKNHRWSEVTVKLPLGPRYAFKAPLPTRRFSDFPFHYFIHHTFDCILNPARGIRTEVFFEVFKPAWPGF